MIRRFAGLITAEDMRYLTENIRLSPDFDLVEASPSQQRNRRLDKFVKAEGKGNRRAVDNSGAVDQRPGMVNFPVTLPVLAARRAGDALVERFHYFIDRAIFGHRNPIPPVPRGIDHETGLIAPQAALAYRKARLPRSVQSAAIRTVGA